MCGRPIIGDGTAACGCGQVPNRGSMVMNTKPTLSGGIDELPIAVRAIQLGALLIAAIPASFRSASVGSFAKEGRPPSSKVAHDSRQASAGGSSDVECPLPPSWLNPPVSELLQETVLRTLESTKCQVMHGGVGLAQQKAKLDASELLEVQCQVLAASTCMTAHQDFVVRQYTAKQLLTERLAREAAG